MRKFLCDLFLTTTVSSLLFVVLEIAICKTPTELSYKHWYMTEKAEKIEILILGNSLASNSFNPHVFGNNVFNAATSGRRQYYDVKILKKYALQMTNLETVMLPLHICMYVEPESPFSNYPYARYMGITSDNNLLYFSALYTGRMIYKSLIPIHILPYVEEEGILIDSIGYWPTFHVWDGHSINIPIKTYEEAMQSKDMFYDQLKEMAEECDSLGVRLICFIPPALDVFTNRIDPRIHDTVSAIMDRLCRMHNVEYKSYFYDSTFQITRIYADEIHLNNSGATLFAQRVKEDFNL